MKRINNQVTMAQPTSTEKFHQAGILQENPVFVPFFGMLPDFRGHFIQQ